MNHDDETKSLRDKLHELGVWVARAKLGIAALIALVIYLGLNAYFPLPEPGASKPAPWLFWPTPSSGWLEFRTALGSALIPFFAFGAVLQILHYKSPDREIANALRNAFASSVELISNFSGAQKREFVKNSLESLLGENIGHSTYDFIKPMLKDDAGFRTDFDYSVIIRDDAPKGAPDSITARFSPEKYRWIRESLTYKLMNPAKAEGEIFSRGPFRVLFLFDKTSLELLNPDQSVFARFLIELEPNDLDWLLEQEDNSAIKAFNEIFVPSLCEKFVSPNREQSLTPTVTLEPPVSDSKNRTKPYFKVEMTKPLSASSGGSSLIIGFTYPYRRTATHFIFTMPQPVYSPTLSFNYNNASIVDVDYSSYYSVADPTKSNPKPPEHDDLRYVFEVNGSWVFPTSGITMVWKNKDDTEG